MRAHGANGRRVQTFLFHGYTIERMQESPANVADALRNFCTDEERLSKNGGSLRWIKLRSQSQDISI